MILKRLLQELTSRERDILQLIARGLTNRAIADRLCVTHETVRWHIRGLYSKLGVQDRFSAIVYGKRLLDSESGAVPSEIPNVLTPQSSGDAPQKRASPKAAREEADWKSFLIS
ncbi:MAG: helix-turn-helix transcriptional regulator [Acidobacteria bacterium]|nr:helix-turn-helix transcriptional regulator [Acidobacteriota bacterium]